MEPPERDRVALDAARRSLKMTEMASGHDNWSNKASYLSRTPGGTGDLDPRAEESGTKELERQLLAKGMPGRRGAAPCLCVCHVPVPVLLPVDGRSCLCASALCGYAHLRGLE